MKPWVIFTTAFFLYGNLVAQDIDPENYSIKERGENIKGFFQVGPSFSILEKNQTSLTSDFGDVTLGFSTSLGLNPIGEGKPSPLLIGIQFTFQTFGRDKLSDPVTSIRYKTAYNYFNVGPITRFYPIKTKKVIPFIEATAGLAVLSSRTKIDRTIFENEEEEVVIGSLNDTSFGYGLSIGLHGNPSRKNNEDLRATFFLSLKYNWSERSKFMTRKSVTVIDDVHRFKTSYTSFNAVQIQLGAFLH
jgi:hypothetical protein